MEVNIWAILLATVAMFAIGAVWYTFIFGKVWSKIHSFYTLSEKKQKEMQKAMGPWYGVQLIVTIASAWVLAILIGLLPDQSPFAIAFLVWLGFVMPTTASNMIFGGAPQGYVWQKILITSSESLVHLLAAAWIIGLF